MLQTTVKKVFVARHGQSEWNGQKRISGQLDPGLTAKGQAQAKGLARVLHTEKLTAIYASPLSRAVATAKPSAELHGLPIQTCAALKEIHLGVLQGRYRDHRDPEARDLWRTWQSDKVTAHIPGGESFVDLETRVEPCLEQLLGHNKAGTILIVAHRSVVRVILGKLMHWSQKDYLPLEIHNHTLYQIEPGPKPVISTVRFDKEADSEKGRPYAGFKS
jgi:broad specificity phosphatase PhoE